MGDVEIWSYPYYGYQYARDVGVSDSGIQECICHVDPILMDEICVEAECRNDRWFFNQYIFDDTFMGKWEMYDDLGNKNLINIGER